MGSVRFSKFGKDLKFFSQVEHSDLRKLEQELARFRPDSPAVFDLNGVEFLGYSYAKQTIRRSFKRFLDGQYKLSAIVLQYDGDDYGVRLDGVRAALAEQNLTIWLLVGDQWIPFGYLSTDGIKDSDKEKRKKAKMKDILDLLKRTGECATNEISSSLGLSLQNANHLLQELAYMHLIDRRKVSSPTGGPLFVNKMVDV